MLNTALSQSQFKLSPKIVREEGTELRISVASVLSFKRLNTI